jgi:hypothetical protein
MTESLARALTPAPLTPRLIRLRQATRGYLPEPEGNELAANLDCDDVTLLESIVMIEQRFPKYAGPHCALPSVASKRALARAVFDAWCEP